MKKKEAPLQIALRVIFIDKDFKYSLSMDFRPSDIENYKKIKSEVFTSIWEQRWNNGIGGILGKYPKGWKSYEQFARAFEKTMKKKQKENQARIKKGLSFMNDKEWQKGIPIFGSTLKVEDIRIIVVGQNCWTRLFDAKNLTAKTMQKIIKDYK